MPRAHGRRRVRAKKVDGAELKPNTRTLRYLAARGWDADLCEHKAGRFITKDLFGFADVFAVGPFPSDFLLVQATSADRGTSKESDVGRRVAKIRAHPVAARLYERGFRIEVWGWDQYLADPIIIAITHFDLPAPESGVSSATDQETPRAAQAASGPLSGE